MSPLIDEAQLCLFVRYLTLTTARVLIAHSSRMYAHVWGLAQSLLKTRVFPLMIDVFFVFRNKAAILWMDLIKSDLHFTRFRWLLDTCSSTDHILHKGRTVLLAVIKNSWYRKTIFALCVDCHHMQSSCTARNTSRKWLIIFYVMVCLNTICAGLH